MILHEINDPELIKKVLCHPDIYERIKGEAKWSIDKFEPPIIPEYQYIGGFLGGDIIAVMIYHSFRDGVKCHPQVLPEYRGKYAKQFTRMALNFGRAKNANIYAEIPVKYPNVKRFAELLGFKDIGSEKPEKVMMRLDNGICI